MSARKPPRLPKAPVVHVSSPADVSPLDLLKLARAESVRYDQFADCGSSEMYGSARLIGQLVCETIDRMDAKPMTPLQRLQAAREKLRSLVSEIEAIAEDLTVGDDNDLVIQLYEACNAIEDQESMLEPLLEQPEHREALGIRAKLVTESEARS
jgi:hypothetical protein